MFDIKASVSTLQAAEPGGLTAHQSCSLCTRRYHSGITCVLQPQQYKAVVEASVITVQNAKAGRRQVEGLLELHKSSLGNLIRPYLKSKNKERAKDIAQCVRY